MYTIEGGTKMIREENISRQELIHLRKDIRDLRERKSSLSLQDQAKMVHKFISNVPSLPVDENFSNRLLSKTNPVKVLAVTGSYIHLLVLSEESELFEFMYDFKSGSKSIRKFGSPVKLNASNYDKALGRDGWVLHSVCNYPVGRKLLAIVKTLGVIGSERTSKVGRALERVEYVPSLEVLVGAYTGKEPIERWAHTLKKNYYCISSLGVERTSNGLQTIGINMYPKTKLIDMSKSNPRDILKCGSARAKMILNGTLSLNTNELLIKNLANTLSFFKTELREKLLKIAIEEMDKILANLKGVLENLDRNYGTTTKSIVLDNLPGVIASEALNNVASRKDVIELLDNDEENLSVLSSAKMGFSGGKVNWWKEAKKANIKLARAIEYIMYEVPVKQGGTISSSKYSQLWKDYLSMLTNNNLTLGGRRFPKYLATEHDMLARSISFCFNSEVDQAFENVMERPYKLYNGYTPSKKNPYQIVVPVTPMELVDEGSQLSHCVGDYVTKVAKDLSVVVFLRSKSNPDKSLVTVEIEGNKVVHATGMANRELNKEEKAFLRSFGKRFGIYIASSL